MNRQLIRRTRHAEIVSPIDSWFGYVYIVKSGELYKIGFSKTPRKRFRAFRTGSAEPLEIVFTLKTPHYKMVEKILHDRLADKRVHGEWFALTDADLAYIKCIDSVGKSLRERAYENAFKDAFDDAEAAGLCRSDAQVFGGWAGKEAMERSKALGCPCDW